MAAEVALLQSDLAAARSRTEESQEKEGESLSRLASQIRELQEDRDRLACDLAKTRFSLQEAIDRENALKMRVDALESHLAVAQYDLEEARTEVEILRGEVAHATSRPSPGTGDASEENDILSLDCNEQPVCSAPLDTTSEPLTQVAGAAPVEEADPPVNTQESPPPAVGAGPQDPSPVSPEEVRAAVFPDAANRVIFTRAYLQLGSQNVTTRANAAKALGGVRHELSVRALAAQAAHEPSPQVRQECIKALTALEMRQGVPAVERALADLAPSVRLAAVRGLYRLAGAEAAPALASTLSDGDEEIRRRAVTCIGWLGAEEHVAAMLSLLTDSSDSVRHAAVDALANLRSLEAVSPLIACLSDAEDSIQRAALAALETITGKKMSESFPADTASGERVIARWRAWWNEDRLCPRSVSAAEGR